MKPSGKNQYSNQPPFCDFLERYQAEHRSGWSKCHLLTTRVGLKRFDEWLRLTKKPLHELDWQTLLDFYRFLACHGISSRACKRSLQIAKHTLKWGIETGELPQKVESLYTFIHMRHQWDIELPEQSLEFLNELTELRPAAHRIHKYSHKVFHTFLNERNLSYKRMKSEDLIAFVKYVNKKGFKTRTAANLCLKARAYIQWLYAHGYIKRSPNELIPSRIIPKIPKGLPRPLSPDIDQQLQTILTDTDDIIYKAILLIRRTGLRISELRKLEFDCIQIDQKDRASLKVPAVKLGLERRVPLDPATVELIQLIKKMSLKHYRRNQPPKFLIIGTRRKRPPYEHYSDALTELCAKLDVPKWINLHALRHTYATSLLNAGLSITSLKEVLGHKSITMSLVYAKVTQEKIHAEYTKALDHLSQQQIPELLIRKEKSEDILFTDLGSKITHIIDSNSDPGERKKLKGLLNRLSKIKAELSKAQMKDQN